MKNALKFGEPIPVQRTEFLRNPSRWFALARADGALHPLRLCEGDRIIAELMFSNSEYLRWSRSRRLPVDQ